MVNIYNMTENLDEGKLTVEFNTSKIVYQSKTQQNNTAIKIYQTKENNAIVLEQENEAMSLTILDEFQITIDHLNQLNLVGRLNDKEKFNILDAFHPNNQPDLINAAIDNVLNHLSNLDITQVEKMKLFENMEKEIERRKRMEF